MSKKEYNKQFQEGNTNMDYRTWKLFNNLYKNKEVMINYTKRESK